MTRWIRQGEGFYRSEDGQRELVYDIDAGAWWDTPAGVNGASLHDVNGPYNLAREAGTLDAPPGLGDNATNLEEA